MGAPNNPNTFFVGIKDTKDLKRAILESTRDTVVFLQKYENFQKIKKEKNETIQELKKMVKEISSLITELKRKLPESELHRRLNKEEVSVEKEIIGIGLKKKKSQSKKANQEAKARDTSDGKQAKQQVSKKENKAKKVSSEMDKLESQLKELEGRLNQFE